MIEKVWRPRSLLSLHKSFSDHTRKGAHIIHYTRPRCEGSWEIILQGPDGCDPTIDSCRNFFQEMRLPRILAFLGWSHYISHVGLSNYFNWKPDFLLRITALILLATECIPANDHQQIPFLEISTIQTLLVLSKVLCPGGEKEIIEPQCCFRRCYPVHLLYQHISSSLISDTYLWKILLFSIS